MPTEGLPHVLAEFARVTSPGAPVLLAFQSGDGQRVDTPTSYGHPVPLTYYRHDAEEVATAMTAAGFDLYATVDRGRALWFESTPQTALLAHRSRPARGPLLVRASASRQAVEAVRRVRQAARSTRTRPTGT